VKRRTARPWILGGVAVILGVAALGTSARYLEQRLAGKIHAAAAAAGLRITFDELRVGLSPPFRMSGLAIERPGQAAVRIDKVTATPRLGPGLRPGLRVWLGSLTAQLPADLEARLKPSVWDLDPGRSLTLISPGGHLVLTSSAGPRGQVLNLEAGRLPLDQLVSFELEDVRNGNLGFLDGEARLEGDPRTDFGASWRFDAVGAETTGSVSVTPAGGGDPDLGIEIRFEGVDFGRVFVALGLQDGEEAPLGSLKGEVSARGTLRDPAGLEVRQEIDFSPPQRLPPGISRLRGDFSHEVITNLGVEKRIEVSPESADFIPLSDVPPLFIRALLIAEDSAFFSHPGIDLTEMPRAIATNWARGEAVRGASTITQQLAKNLFLNREKSLHRKLKELSYSFLLESAIGKSRILEIYLNIIEWGPGLYGLKPAARHYFAKHPQALTPKEIAFLVSMIPGPIKYQRSIQGGEMGPGFENLVNNLLVKLRSVDALTEEEYEAARAETLVIGPLSEEATSKEAPR